LTFDVGTKFYGKVTPKGTLGLLHTIDFGNRDDVVVRYRQDLSSTASTGIFFTQKSATDDNNTVGVLSHNARWGKLTLDSQWALSSGREAGGDAKQVVLAYADKLNFTFLGYSEWSPRFRDADGLISFTDIRGPVLFSNWGAQWRTGFWR